MRVVMPILFVLVLLGMFFAAALAPMYTPTLMEAWERWRLRAALERKNQRFIEDVARDEVEFDVVEPQIRHRAQCVDVYGTPVEVRYRPTEDVYAVTVRSAGADRTFDTRDDVEYALERRKP